MLAQLEGDLADAGLAGWYEQLAPLIDERLAPGAHGDMPAWRRAVDVLPEHPGGTTRLGDDIVQLAAGAAIDRDALTALLRQLSPWRKGPFEVAGVAIDAEWRSDLKWRRLARAITPLHGRRVLDVGCGNGYYALRMRGAGAALVIGIDPTLLYVMQFRALARFLGREPVHVLPLRLSELPAQNHAFDTVFSMGVLYHQRAPLEHLRELRDSLRPGGELVLETLVLPGDEAYSRTPTDRYARMKNVWHLPTVAELMTWLTRSGLSEPRLIDVTATTEAEQRSTAWMPRESLAEALAPDDPARTVEGWPAPRRALLLARTRHNT